MLLVGNFEDMKCSCMDWVDPCNFGTLVEDIVLHSRAAVDIEGNLPHKVDTDCNLHRLVEPAVVGVCSA